MTTSLFERGLGTAPNPLNWNIQRISLDSYPAKPLKTRKLLVISVCPVTHPLTISTLLLDLTHKLQYKSSLFLKKL